MEYSTKIINLQDYVLDNVTEYWETILYTVIAFCIPLFLAHPQLLVGTVVNAMLITSALNLRSYRLFPVIIAPSLGALSAGLLFGSFTVFLLYLIPFIWIGNTIIVLGFKWLKLHKKYNYAITLIASSAAKALFLFGSAYLLFSLGLIPVQLLAAMGLIQLTTAISGGILAYGIHQAKKVIIN